MYYKKYVTHHALYSVIYTNKFIDSYILLIWDEPMQFNHELHQSHPSRLFCLLYQNNFYNLLQKWNSTHETNRTTSSFKPCFPQKTLYTPIFASQYPPRENPFALRARDHINPWSKPFKQIQPTPIYTPHIRRLQCNLIHKLHWSRPRWGVYYACFIRKYSIICWI